MLTDQGLSAHLPQKPGDKRHWGQLHGSSLSLAVLTAAQSHTGLTCVITADTVSADRLEQELNFYNCPQNPLRIFQLPDWETLAYDSFSPHQDIISQRLLTLYQLPHLQQGILLVPITTLMHRLAPVNYLQASSLVLKTGQHFAPHTMRQQLESVGYHCVDSVYEHGEFAIRGSLMDIYPMGSEHPYRIDLLDEEVDSLRTFDPETQRSIDKIDEIRLLPAKEFPLNQQGIKTFIERWYEFFDVDVKSSTVFLDIKEGIASPGIEYYLPLFFPSSEPLFNYIPNNSLVFTNGDIETAASTFWQECQNRYESRRYDITRPILPPQQIFLTVDELFSNLKAYPRIIATNELQAPKAGRLNFPVNIPPDLFIDAKADRPLSALEAFLADYQGKVLFCAESAGRRESLLELLQRIALRPREFTHWHEFLAAESKLGICVFPLEQGLQLHQPDITIIAEPQLFGQRVMQRRRRGKSTDNTELAIKNLTELNIGAPVVHIEHGVGRYVGLQTITVDNQDTEFLTLEYAENAKLYVPVASLHLISRYSASTQNLAPLHKLGNEQWQKSKKKAAEKIQDVAAELLDIYARRAARKGFGFTNTDEDYEKFCAGFPFEETPDQEMSIQSVIGDMVKDKPMDRLVCGDVGFGKTEVAMRAAFIAIQSEKQVSILVPTTLLAQQHYETFKDRFADWPVNIDLLSRFRSSKEQTQTIRQVQEGKVDIVIGTHRLLQKDIHYKNLGLVIIDEEHRFGVQQKEKLKALRTTVDILTLTATPIPRTLNMAMSGMRDLSIIATPPARRLSVKTFVRTHDEALIKEAILRELLRGGQVYYLHNDVKTIEQTANRLMEIVPEARLIIGHGQMRERELEQVMSDFYHKRHNILVCTTIIETGIDIPNANTIIINRADKFGLAQLHQLRGRVGRSHHQAYAYLLTPHKKIMTSDAIKRLEAIEAADTLGAGFTLATHDLEIRGAGELLGEDQSGQLETIGFTLYMEMLEQAVEAIKAGKTPNVDKPMHYGSEINLNISALIPEHYLPDVHTRLIMYKRISSCKNATELKELQVEMIDRFGLITEEIKYLFRVTLLKLEAQALGINKIDAGPKGGKIAFAANTKVEPFTLVQMIQSAPHRYRLDGPNQMKFSIETKNAEQRIQEVSALLKLLTKSPNCI